MNFHCITLFPDMIEQATSYGVVGQARKSGTVRVSAITPREFTTNVHQTVDDRPFGGGDGMIMLAEPLTLAIEKVRSGIEGKPRVIHLSPRGRPLTDRLARELAGEKDIVLIASRYGGVDQRFLNECVDEEISVGDYVLSGGELPALCLIDAVSRHLPGVLGNESSADAESFAHGAALEHPQFTRPREWRGAKVPEGLLSGNHAKIEAWKRSLSLFVSLERRPDLVKPLDKKQWKEASEVLASLSEEDISACGLSDIACIRERLQALKRP